VNGWIDDLEATRRKGIDLARQAIRFAPDDPEALATGGFALGYFGEDIDGAIRLIDRSLALNPSFAAVGCGAQCSGILLVSLVSRSSTTTNRSA